MNSPDNSSGCGSSIRSLDLRSSLVDGESLHLSENSNPNLHETNSNSNSTISAVNGEPENLTENNPSLHLDTDLADEVSSHLSRNRTDNLPLSNSVSNLMFSMATEIENQGETAEEDAVRLTRDNPEYLNVQQTPESLRVNQLSVHEAIEMASNLRKILETTRCMDEKHLQTIKSELEICLSLTLNLTETRTQNIATCSKRNTGADNINEQGFMLLQNKGQDHENTISIHQDGSMVTNLNSNKSTPDLTSLPPVSECKQSKLRIRIVQSTAFICNVVLPCFILSTLAASISQWTIFNDIEFDTDKINGTVFYRVNSHGPHGKLMIYLEFEGHSLDNDWKILNFCASFLKSTKNTSLWATTVAATLFFMVIVIDINISNFREVITTLYRKLCSKKKNRNQVSNFGDIITV